MTATTTTTVDCNSYTVLDQKYQECFTTAMGTTTDPITTATTIDKTVLMTAMQRFCRYVSFLHAAPSQV